jgi:hypothetical protein
MASKEVLMQPTPNPRRSQLELFRPSIQIPQWTAIPSDLQKTTIQLLLRLFRHYREDQRVLGKDEVGNE